METHNTPIWRDEQRLLILVEEAVWHFPRYHKYGLGSDLRRHALWICQLINRAWCDQRNRRGGLFTQRTQASSVAVGLVATTTAATPIFSKNGVKSCA